LRDPLQVSVLVVGAGSIGARHLRNLRQLGVQRLSVCEPDPERSAPLAKELGIAAFSDFAHAFSAQKPDAVFICTPPVCHVSLALQALECGAHIFIEKPLSHDLQGVDELIRVSVEQKRIVQVGYNLRFHPGLKQLKELIDHGTLGRVLWACVEAGQYLPDWRPWQDYRQSYTARRDLGGGILLDGSHELDYVLWLLGKPCAVMCMAGRVSDLAVNVEDCADLLLRFSSGTQVQVHLDFVQRGYARTCKLVGERATACWDFCQNEVRVFSGDDKRWESLAYSFEPNDMYVAEARHFLECIAAGEPPVVPLADATDTLKLVLMAKSAAASGPMEWS